MTIATSPAEAAPRLVEFKQAIRDEQGRLTGTLKRLIPDPNFLEA